LSIYARSPGGLPNPSLRPSLFLTADCSEFKPFLPAAPGAVRCASALFSIEACQQARALISFSNQASSSSCETAAPCPKSYTQPDVKLVILQVAYGISPKTMQLVCAHLRSPEPTSTTVSHQPNTSPYDPCFVKPSPPCCCPACVHATTKSAGTAVLLPPILALQGYAFSHAAYRHHVRTQSRSVGLLHRCPATLFHDL
jgi:hypothetical protein